MRSCPRSSAEGRTYRTARGHEHTLTLLAQRLKDLFFQNTTRGLSRDTYLTIFSIEKTVSCPFNLDKVSVDIPRIPLQVVCADLSSILKVVFAFPMQPGANELRNPNISPVSVLTAKSNITESGSYPGATKVPEQLKFTGAAEETPRAKTTQTKNVKVFTLNPNVDVRLYRAYVMIPTAPHVEAACLSCHHARRTTRGPACS